jgi:hypothetical protein
MMNEDELREEEAEEFLEDFRASLEFRVEPSDIGPIVDEERHCQDCVKDGFKTKLIVKGIKRSSEENTQPLLFLECDRCKACYRKRLYFTIGLEFSGDFARLEKVVKPPATIFTMPKPS